MVCPRCAAILVGTRGLRCRSPVAAEDGTFCTSHSPTIMARRKEALAATRASKAAQPKEKPVMESVSGALQIARAQLVRLVYQYERDTDYALALAPQDRRAAAEWAAIVSALLPLPDVDTTPIVPRACR